MDGKRSDFHSRGDLNRAIISTSALRLTISRKATRNAAGNFNQRLLCVGLSVAQLQVIDYPKAVFSLQCVSVVSAGRSA